MERRPPSDEERARRRERRRRAVRRRRIVAVGTLLAAAAAFAAGVTLGSGGEDEAEASTPAAGRAPPASGDPQPAAGAPGGLQGEAAPPPDAEVSIAAVGDITMGATPDLPPSGAAGFFEQVASHLTGDVVLGNLETTLTNATTSQCSRRPSAACFDFRVPPSYARRLAEAGFTVLSLANNHSFDYYERGRRDTVRALRRQGIRITGLRGQIAYQEVGRVRVALLGFATYEWAESMLELGRVAELVGEAARNADVVVVTMHGGGEGVDHQRVRPGTETFLGENRGDVLRVARTAVDAGADLVVGHGPHVLRGMEWYKGRLVAYSLGNFSGWNTFSLDGVNAISGILRVTLHADGTWVKGDLFATQLLDPGLPAPDAAERAHGVVRRLSRADFGRRAVRITPAGVIRPPQS